MKHLFVFALCLLAGCGEAVSTIDTSKPTQVVTLNGGLELQIDHTAGRIFAQSKNTKAVGVVVADAATRSVRIFAKANIPGGQRVDDGADLSPRQAFATVYVYKDTVNGILLDTLDTFGFDFDQHLHSDWIDSVEATPFTIE